MIEETERPEGAPKLRASRWLRNGDHPDDRVGEREADPLTGKPWMRQEGAVIRFHRRPDRPGDARHEGRGGCYELWSAHGWIDQGGAGLDVCPGDLVIDWPDGTHTVAKLEQTYRDRTENYVPAGLPAPGRQERQAEISEGSKGRSAATLEVYMSAAAGVIRGLLELMESEQVTAEWTERNVHAAYQWLERCAEPAEWERYRAPRTARVALAKADEHNRDQGDWWWADVSGNGTHWARFDGHHTQVDITFSTMNYRDTHEWKGRDEIRAGGHWTISLNRQPVYEGGIGGDPLLALERLREKLRWLLGEADFSGALNLSDPRPFKEQLVGRRVYYHDVPAVITSTVLEQGCVILEPVGRSHFPRTARDLDAEPDGTGHDEQDLWDPYEERSVKTHLDDPHIYWWRKRSYSPLEPDTRYRPERKQSNGPGEGGEPNGGMTVVKQRSRWEPLSASLPDAGAPGVPEDAPAVPTLAQVDEDQARMAAASMPVEVEDEPDDLPGVDAGGESEGDEGDGTGDQPEA